MNQGKLEMVKQEQPLGVKKKKERNSQIWSLLHEIKHFSYFSNQVHRRKTFCNQKMKTQGAPLVKWMTFK